MGQKGNVLQTYISKGYESQNTKHLKASNIEYIINNNKALNVSRACCIQRFWTMCTKEYRTYLDKPKLKTSLKRLLNQFG